MRVIVIILIACVLNFTKGMCQIEIGAGLGVPRLTNKPTGVDMQSSISIYTYFKKEIPVARSWVVEPGFIIMNSNVFTDGHFAKSASGKLSFQTIPPDYQQNALQLTSVSVPVLMKYQAFSNESGEGIAIGIGPYLQYMVNVRQAYKQSGINKSEKVVLDNRFQSGLIFDFGTSGSVLNKNRFGFGVGIQYQLTNYLQDGSAFKLLIPYLRFGIRF